MNTELTDHLKKSALAAIINLDTSSVSAADLMFTEFESNEVITSLLFLLAFNDETNNKFTLNEKIKDVLVVSCYEHLSNKNKYEFNTQWLYKIIDKWGAGIIQALIPRHFFSRYLLLDLINYISDYDIAETLLDEMDNDDPEYRTNAKIALLDLKGQTIDINYRNIFNWFNEDIQLTSYVADGRDEAMSLLHILKYMLKHEFPLEYINQTVEKLKSLFNVKGIMPFWRDAATALVLATSHHSLAQEYIALAMELNVSSMPSEDLIFYRLSHGLIDLPTACDALLVGYPIQSNLQILRDYFALEKQSEVFLAIADASLIDNKNDKLNANTLLTLCEHISSEHALNNTLMARLDREYAPGFISYALTHAPDKVESLLVLARESRNLWTERSANTEFFSHAIHVEPEHAFKRLFTEVPTNHIDYKLFMANFTEQHWAYFMAGLEEHFASTTDYIRYKTLRSIPISVIPEQYIEKFKQWIIELEYGFDRDKIFSELTLPANQLQALLIKLQEQPLD
ncbi:hypothetical protein [Pseudoalteromonas sp. SR41-1]|uniref:hypothetical protein n=1 Tax=Pseudoalteromonas sp. SR41-1 TaxID=2760952 RepID=UPI001601FDDB|nr:hypothetical protein [Pseudoalteromonas sp. SR41-1]MBB1282573.1 hypothetical protein [Pseudoalteromonas sp. SR41-1]